MVADDRCRGGEGDRIPLLCFCSTALKTELLCCNQVLKQKPCDSREQAGTVLYSVQNGILYAFCVSVCVRVPCVYDFRSAAPASSIITNQC